MVNTTVYQSSQLKEKNNDMAPSTSSNVTLLSNIVWIFRKTIPLLKSTEKDELKHSYSHFAASCILITEHLDRSRKLPSENHHVRRMLEILQSLISESLNLEAKGPYPCLRALDHRWNEIEQATEAKLEFIRLYFNLGSTPAEREAINNALEKCYDDLVAEFPDDSFRWTSKDFTPLEKRSEPSYEVWTAANTLYKTLLASKNCQCHSSVNYHTLLCLGTWRKSDNMDLNENHCFDMFLSLEVFRQEAFWQQIHIQTIKEKKESQVKFTIADETPVKITGNQHAKGAGRMKIKKFCENLETAKRYSRRRLNLQVENDQLFKLLSDNCQFQIDTSKDPLSLEKFIEQSPQVLTVKTKGVLAVLLSYTVLHLSGTPFLKSWGPSSVVFLWTKNSIPVRPYLRSQVMSYEDGESTRTYGAQISGHEDHGDIDPDNFDPYDIDPDEWMPTHQCPSLVTLGMMLLEIHLGMSFRLLAKKYNVELGDGSDSLRHFMDVDEVFKHCKSEIPENTKLYLALNNCLEMNLWQDENQQPLDEYTLRSTIYSEVVKPLEDDLNAAFTYISIDELDSIAQTLDLSWGRHIEIEGSDTQSHQQIQRADLPLPPNQSSHLRIPYTDVEGSYRVQSRGRTLRRAGGHKSFEFYDSSSESIQQGSIDRYQEWKNNFLDVYDKFVTDYLDDEGPDEPVKIAILDTGIDFPESRQRDWGDKIKRKRNFLGPDVKDHKDRIGHGTHIAGLICEYAPHAEIYVARISDDTPGDPLIIAKAIDYAVEKWNVDIISMSFGFPDRDIDSYHSLQNSIEKAHASHCLLIAAASNSGANLQRAYPARHEEVICVHSTNHNGNRSEFSPTAIRGHNFATIGEAVGSAWPSSLTKEGPGDVYKSGTSFATPIAASIGAFLLQFARLHFTAEEAQELKKTSRMKAVLAAIAKQESRDDYEYIELSLSGDNFFGKKDLVKLRLLDAMKHSS